MPTGGTKDAQKVSTWAEIELGLCGCVTCRMTEEFTRWARERDTTEWRESLVFYRALMLAKDYETGVELLRSGKAPTSRLRPEWVKAYGLS